MKIKHQKHSLWLSTLFIFGTFLLAIYFLTGCAAWKPAPWTKADTIREGAVLGLFLADYGQTADIVDSPEYFERNPILGRYPSIQQVRWYFAGCAVAHAG